MSKLSYIKLINNTLDYYLKNEYEKGYKYITDTQDKVDGNKAQIYNFRYTLACKAGNIDLANDILKDAVFNKGFWYSKDYLLGDDDLKPLREKNDFGQIIKECTKREKKAKESTKPELKIYLPEGYNQNESNSLVLILHGNQENIDIVYQYWKNLIYDQNILALPQSSQIEFSDAYSWNNVKRGAVELKKHYNNILNNYNISKESLVLGGFSAGTQVILEAIENKYLTPTGLIFMAPWLPDIENKKEVFKLLKDNDIKVYLLVGDQDKDCLEVSKIFIKLLDSYQIKYKSKIIDNLNHDYPDSFDNELIKAINFIDLNQKGDE